MAPTVITETVVIIKSLMIVPFCCEVSGIVLMIMALSSSEWLVAEGWRQGLFAHCIEVGAPSPLPFNFIGTPNCHPVREVAYIQAAFALCIITLLTCVIATILTGLGLRSNSSKKKYKYYKVSVYVLVLSFMSDLIALIAYPVCFIAELKEGNRKIWELGWSYGVGCVAAIFLFVAAIFILLNLEPERIYRKKRKNDRRRILLRSVKFDV